MPRTLKRYETPLSWLSRAWIGRLGLLACFLAMGCGQFRRDGAVHPPAEPTELESSAPLPTEWRVRLFQAGQDPHLPATELMGMDEKLTEGSIIQLKNRIALPDLQKNEKPLFLTFSEHLGGAVIQRAFFEHRIQGVRNLFDGDVSPRNVSYSKNRGFWFIPLEEALSGPGRVASPIDQQILTLDLLLSGGTRRRIEVRFFVQPVLRDSIEIQSGVEVESLSKERPEPDSLWEVLKKGNEEGFVLGTEIYRNPSSRPLNLWFSPHPEPVELQTRLGLKLIPDCGNMSKEQCDRLFYQDLAQPVYPADSYRIARTQLWVHGLRLLRAQGVSDLKFTPGAPLMITLAAGEELRLQWVARPETGATSCPVRQKVLVNYWYCFHGTSLSLRPTRGESCQGVFGNPETQPIPTEAFWQVVGIRIPGVPQSEVWVGEEGNPFERVLRGEGGRALRNGRSSSAAVLGQKPAPQSKDYHCQGVFR